MKINLPDGNSPLEDYRFFADVDFIVTDLDGTLIDGEEPVMKQIKDLLRKLKWKKQVGFTVATGRTYSGSKTRIQELGIEQGVPVALYNGGVVIDHGTGNIRHNSCIPHSAVQELLDTIGPDNLNVYVYTIETKRPFSFDNTDMLFDEQVYGFRKQAKGYDVNGMPVRVISSADEISEDVCAVLVELNYLSGDYEDGIYAVLDKYTDIRITNSGNGFLEINGTPKNKGIIFDILRKDSRYSAKKILAIGDNDNDVELFREADISVAVANSSQSAIDSSKYVCDRASANGFYEMLCVLENAKRYFQGR